MERSRATSKFNDLIVREVRSIELPTLFCNEAMALIFIRTFSNGSNGQSDRKQISGNCQALQFLIYNSFQQAPYPKALL